MATKKKAAKKKAAPKKKAAKKRNKLKNFFNDIESPGSLRDFFILQLLINHKLEVWITPQSPIILTCSPN
ncbi:MAG: hypothetical protein IPP39_13645 [Chitinophagaceae bacterium]|nr:hypothetical protein [Chitinophagaceae bacterium]